MILSELAANETFFKLFFFFDKFKFICVVYDEFYIDLLLLLFSI